MEKLKLLEKIQKSHMVPENGTVRVKQYTLASLTHICSQGSENPKFLELNHDDHILATADLSFHGLPSSGKDLGGKKPGFEVSGVHPQRKLIDSLDTEEDKWGKLREYGFTSAHLAPAEGIFRGTGPFVHLSEQEPNELILKNEVAQIIAFDPVGKNSSPSVYPASLMGVLSVIRQSILETNYANKRVQFEIKNQIRDGFSPPYSVPKLSPAVLEKTKVFPFGSNQEVA
jgi:hypothetical protein